MFMAMAVVLEQQSPLDARCGDMAAHSYAGPGKVVGSSTVSYRELPRSHTVEVIDSFSRLDGFEIWAPVGLAQVALKDL